MTWLLPRVAFAVLAMLGGAALGFALGEAAHAPASRVAVTSPIAARLMVATVLAVKQFIYLTLSWLVNHLVGKSSLTSALPKRRADFICNINAKT